MQLVSFGAAYGGNPDTCSLLAIGVVFYDDVWGKKLAELPSITWLFMPEEITFSPALVDMVMGYTKAAVSQRTPLSKLGDILLPLTTLYQQFDFVRPGIVVVPRYNCAVSTSIQRDVALNPLHGRVVMFEKEIAEFEMATATHPASKIAVNVMGTFLLTLKQEEV